MGGGHLNAASLSTMTRRVRLVIADDHPLFREGLARAVKERPDLELVAVVADGRSALAQIREEHPDVALVDQRMEGLTGTQIVNAVKRDKLATRVVLLSAFAGSDLIYEAMTLGACGFLSKDAERADILDAVVAVARGETRISPILQGGLVEQIRMRETADRPVLSPREQEVLALVADGLSAPEIAAHLQLGTTTIKTHLQAIYEKLGVADRAAAVATAMRCGLLE